MRLFFPSLFVKNKPDGDSGDSLSHSLAVANDAHWTQLLHRGFSVDERARIHEVGLETKAFLADARAWDLERKMYLERLG